MMNSTDQIDTEIIQRESLAILARTKKKLKKETIIKSVFDLFTFSINYKDNVKSTDFKF